MTPTKLWEFFVGAIHKLPVPKCTVKPQLDAEVILPYIFNETINYTKNRLYKVYASIFEN